MTVNRPTHVRFTLSRPLTWAERNALAEIVKEDLAILGHQVKMEEGAQVVHLYSHEDSRYLGEEFHLFLAREFVNVYIRAIRTVYPRVKV